MIENVKRMQNMKKKTNFEKNGDRTFFHVTAELLEMGRKIENPDDVKFVDIHRLSQHLVNNRGKTFHWPIIAKQRWATKT